MLKRTFTFTDYDGNARTEEHFFNINRSEATKLELGTTGGLTKMIEDIIAAQDHPTIIDMFEKIILLSYGKKSPDGRRFMKSEEISRDFKETEAYDELFMELISDEEKAAAFVNGIISFNENDSDKKDSEDGSTSGNLQVVNQNE